MNKRNQETEHHHPSLPAELKRVWLLVEMVHLANWFSVHQQYQHSGIWDFLWLLMTWEARSRVGICCCSVARSCPTWRPHRAQHARLPYPSLFTSVCSNSCLLIQRCHLTILSSAILFSFCLQSFPASDLLQWVIFHISWPKYWGFSLNISSSNEYSQLISFRIDWFDLLGVQGTLKSLLQHHISKASSM